MTLEEMYARNSSTQSDINEHLPVLRSLADECRHVTEMGTRWGDGSTIAFLASTAPVVVSYDIERFSQIDELERVCRQENRVWVFHKASTLEIEIDETDLLFIDTLHTYEQLKQELSLHGNKARRYLVFHDTEGAFGERLRPAIYEHCQDNAHWTEKARYTNNNGIIVLERI